MRSCIQEERPFKYQQMATKTQMTAEKIPLNRLLANVGQKNNGQAFFLSSFLCMLN